MNPEFNSKLNVLDLLLYRGVWERRLICKIMNYIIFLVLLVYFCHGSGYTPSKFYYIYEWPSEYNDVYPPVNATLHKDAHYDHSFNENNGAGRLLNPDVGLFSTWQFSLYKNVMSRLRISRYRTRDPSKASAFIVPFDIGVHSQVDHRHGKGRLASPYAWAVIALLQEASTKSIFWKNNGHDHFVFYSLTEFVMTGIGAKEFWGGQCQVKDI